MGMSRGSQVGEGAEGLGEGLLGGARRPPRWSPGRSEPCCGTASSGRRGSARGGDEAVEVAVHRGGGLRAVARRVGVKGYSARQPSRVTCQGRPCAAIAARTPASKRSPSAIIRSKASSVRTSSRVARIAASESALPASVPPMPPTSASLARVAARASRRPRRSCRRRAAGTPPPSGLPIVERSRARGRGRAV